MERPVSLGPLRRSTPGEDVYDLIASASHSPLLIDGIPGRRRSRGQEAMREHLTRARVRHLATFD